ncbi:hypothetical protein GOP47_0013419 [Adiantum capillus-veneris]|uniref:RRM domain-containing protein n=1 Tax=Adiantum capillus-veneris TaxID=13818 RepID=A0A9D4ZD64_ADICA|nr:hypothetical protein GOP47_0013419 [Adiantum capillus-veneris]
MKTRPRKPIASLNETSLSVKKTPLKRVARSSLTTPGSSHAESSSAAVRRAHRKATASLATKSHASRRKHVAVEKLLEDAKTVIKHSVKPSSSRGCSQNQSMPQPSDLAMKSNDEVTWIIISNVHPGAAYEDLIQVLFGRIGELRGLTIHRDANGHCQGSIDVAFEKREDAEEAVTHYGNNIALFGMPWEIQQFGKRRCTRLHYTGSSSTRQSFRLRSKKLAASTIQSSSSILPAVKRTQRLEASGAFEIGVSARVLISNIDPRVPAEIIELLFQKAGKLKSHHVHYEATSYKLGTAVVVYERSEDAVAAVKHFKNNIEFFNVTWDIVLDYEPLAKARSGQRGHSRLSN